MTDTSKNQGVGTWLIGLAVLGALVAVFFPTLKETARVCWENDDYSHGLLLPFISGYLIWVNRDRVLEAAKEGPQFSWTGVLLIVVGIVVLFLGEAGGLLFIRWVGFFPALIGSIFLVLGPKVGKTLITPILLLYMARPLPHSVVPILFYPLQVHNAQISAWVLETLNVPVYIVGNIIEIPNMRLLVEEACSGMRSVMALLTVAFIVTALVPIPNYAKALIAFLSVVIAVVLNVVRVAMTGVLAHFYDPEAAKGFFHEFSGMIVFIIGLVILYSVASYIEKATLKKSEA